MPSPDPGEVWEQAVASALTQASTPGAPAKSTRTCPLPMRRKPKVVHLPNLPRTVAGIAPGLRAAIRECVAGRAPWPLFLHGPQGTGKTYAGLCMLDHSAGWYWALPDLCADLVAAQNGRLSDAAATVHEPQLWHRITKAALIVLDELGTRREVSDFAYETLKRVLDRRERRPLVCISNLDAATLLKLYDARIVDRLMAGTAVELAGRTRRGD